MAAEADILVRYDAGRVSLIGSGRQDVVITTEKMLHELLETGSQRAADLIGIATGAYAIDRVVRRSPAAKNECGMRTFRARFEVWDLAFWSQTEMIELLTDILCDLTGDTWLVSFSKRPHPHRTTTVQRRFPFRGPEPTRIALYSGGLDSAAGLANQLLRGGENFLLLTVGHQSTIRRASRDQIRHLRTIVEPDALYHASLMVRFDGGVAGQMKRQQTTQRVRGLLFYAMAAILADACRVDDVDVFENGVGAINLPLTEGAMVDGFTTRGANPGILAKIALLGGKTLERSMCFHLPFINSTKAEMLAPLANRAALIEWLKLSRSCIHSSLRIARKRHCGHCPACIERRQAFRAASVEDDRRDYERDLFSGDLPEEPGYLLVYLENARSWVDFDPAIRSRLERHLILSDMTKISRDAAEDLLARHAIETLNTYGHIEISKAA